MLLLSYKARSGMAEYLVQKEFQTVGDRIVWSRVMAPIVIHQQ